MTGRTALLKLSIEVESDPIHGSLSTGSGDVRQFSGWIELVAAIEGARAGDPRAATLKLWGGPLGRTESDRS